MFKQYFYKVLFVEMVEGSPAWKEEDVEQLLLNTMGEVTTVKTSEERLLTIDNTAVFLREGTGKFDKVGAMLFGGDIVKIPIAVSKFDISTVPQDASQEEINKLIEDSKEVTEVFVSISWVNGAYCLNIENPELTVYLTEGNCMQMEKVGNTYQHASLLEKPVDESVFKQNEQAQA